MKFLVAKQKTSERSKLASTIPNDEIRRAVPQPTDIKIKTVKWQNISKIWNEWQNRNHIEIVACNICEIDSTDARMAASQVWGNLDCEIPKYLATWSRSVVWHGKHALRKCAEVSEWKLVTKNGKIGKIPTMRSIIGKIPTHRNFRRRRILICFNN